MIRVTVNNTETGEENVFEGDGVFLMVTQGVEGCHVAAENVNAMQLGAMMASDTDMLADAVNAANLITLMKMRQRAMEQEEAGQGPEDEN